MDTPKSQINETIKPSTDLGLWRQDLKRGLYSRRKELIDSMDSLESQNVSCRHCPGTCCTFVSNSMQMTVIETLDLYFYLREEGLWNQELEGRLEKTITDFRLHVRPSTGAGQLMRKTYTCPFFGHKNLGCPLPKEVKPYGCLGFNPTEVQEESGKSCKSDFELLQKREEGTRDSSNFDLNEEQLNLQWQKRLKLAWSKECIPIALLEVHQTGVYGDFNKEKA